MTAISNYLENKLVDATLRGVSFTSPAKVYLALFTSDPTEAGSGTEVSGAGYTRKEITFGAPVDGSTVSSGDVFFPVATASWGTVSHLAIFDAVSGGNMLYYGSIATPKTINTDDQLKVSSGDITITLR